MSNPYEDAALEILGLCEEKTGKQLVRGKWEGWLSAALAHQDHLTNDTKQRLVHLLDLTDFGRDAVAYWMKRTGCDELEALRHVSGGPALLQPGHKLGKGWH